MRALFSVSDKTGVVEFASQLVALGWEIIATGGTMKLLQDAGLNVINISEVTGFPEICDGRVKTLHPKVHGGLLGRRDLESHISQLKENGIGFIDMVCVNLYPFRQTSAKPGVTMEVGDTTKETRLRLSAEAYTHTAEYDRMIASYMRSAAGLNEKLFLEYDLKQSLRYGENPHQSAKFFASAEKVPFSLASARQLNGKELSYNNIQDANAALNIVREFDAPFCVGLKHMNPCGAAVGTDVVDAWTKAYEADKVSIFGGIVAVNREVNKEVAELMKPIFLEIIMAPSFTPEALEVLCTKKNLRLLEVDMTRDNSPRMQYVSVNGGMLVQNQDIDTVEVTPEMCVTAAKPCEGCMSDLNFAWRIVKHIKSNAIVVVKDGVTLGVGAGQMNRIGSAEIALKQAEATCRERGLDVREIGLVMGSDAYGVKAIAQPGGSVRDADSIKKADECGIVMLFTGERHFKH